MSKIRIYELAKELNIPSKKLIELLQEEFGVKVKNHMSAIEEEDADLIKEFMEESEEKGEKMIKNLISTEAKMRVPENPIRKVIEREKKFEGQRFGEDR